MFNYTLLLCVCERVCVHVCVCLCGWVEAESNANLCIHREALCCDSLLLLLDLTCEVSCRSLSESGVGVATRHSSEPPCSDGSILPSFSLFRRLLCRHRPLPHLHPKNLPSHVAGRRIPVADRSHQSPSKRCPPHSALQPRELRTTFFKS